MTTMVFTKLSELREIQTLAAVEHPWLIDIETAMIIATNKFGADTEFAVHALPWPNPVCLVLIVRNKYCVQFVSCKPLKEGQNSDVLRNHLLDIFQELAEYSDIAIYSTSDWINDPIATALSSIYTFSPPLPSYTYYMTKETRAKVAEMDIPLPKGFHFYELDPERDSAYISSTWKYATDTEVLNTKSKLNSLPSIGIKFEDKLIAFEMCFSSGAMNHLYVDPEYRGKGLGTAIELRLSQKLIAANLPPHKFVEIHNATALAFAEKSKYFTKVLHRNSSEPILYDCRHMAKRRVN